MLENCRKGKENGNIREVLIREKRGFMENIIYDCVMSMIRKGALVSRGGEYLSPSSQMESIKALFEDNRYMTDFLEDEEGRVIEVRFDMVTSGL